MDPDLATFLADVDISPNPNPFNFWTSESEYIKKTGIRIHFFFKIEGIRESNCDMLRIHLFGQNPYESIYGLESEYISFLAIEYEYNYPWRDMDLSPTCCSTKVQPAIMHVDRVWVSYWSLVLAPWSFM